MKFFKEFSQPLLILRIYGICSYSINSVFTEITCETRDLIYTLLHSSIICTATIYTIWHAFFSVIKLADFLNDIFNIAAFFLLCSTIVIYALTILTLTLQRYTMIKFLQQINQICTLNVREKLNFNHHRNIFVLYALWNTIGTAYFNWNFSLYATFFAICYSWMYISIYLTSGFARYITMTIIDQCELIIIHLNDLLALDLSSGYNYRQLSNEFKHLEKLFQLKWKFNECYGRQLLLSATFDFIVLTISIFSSIVLLGYARLGYRTDYREFYYICFYIMPQGFKVFLLTQLMEKFGKQVGCFKSLWNICKSVASRLITYTV